VDQKADPNGPTTTTSTATRATMTAVNPNPKSLAPFNPSSQQIIDIAIDVLDLKRHDVLFDIGCGDARLLIEAATRVDGLKCVGIEIDEVFVQRARHAIAELPHSVSSRIDVRHEDALEIPHRRQRQLEPTTTACTEERKSKSSSPSTATRDGVNPADATEKTDKPLSELSLLDDVTALYLFVLPKGIVKLTPSLIEMVERRKQKGGTTLRILSYMFKLHDWEPTKVDKTAKGGLPVYYYEFPPSNDT
jgi:SAM-dependent methyltransferase